MSACGSHRPSYIKHLWSVRTLLSACSAHCSSRKMYLPAYSIHLTSHIERLWSVTTHLSSCSTHCSSPTIHWLACSTHQPSYIKQCWSVAIFLTSHIAGKNISKKLRSLKRAYTNFFLKELIPIFSFEKIYLFSLFYHCTINVDLVTYTTADVKNDAG